MNIKTYLIKELKKVNNGTIYLINIVIDSEKLEALYWTNIEDDILELPDEFLNKFNISESENLPFYKELIEDIHTLFI